MTEPNADLFILTVLLTLTVIGIVYVIFQQGVEHGRRQNDNYFQTPPPKPEPTDDYIRGYTSGYKKGVVEANRENNRS